MEPTCYYLVKVVSQERLFLFAPFKIRTQNSEQYINYPRILEEDIALTQGNEAHWSWSSLSTDEQGLSCQEKSP